MLARILRSLIALATIIVVYQGYVLLAVPLLEPPLAARPGTPATEESRDAARQSFRKYQKLLSNYFPAEHWSQQRPPKVLMNGPALLVLDSYQRFDDGRVDIPQFAVLIFPTPMEEGGPAPRDAIILEAPQGATLQFDENFRLERGQVGQITHGNFPGPITIRSDMQEPGPEDDLLIETAELSMTTKLLYSNKPVRFRMGSNVGSGRELEIRLLEGPDARSNKMGVASIEILRDVRLRVDLKTDDLLPGQLSASVASPSSNVRNEPAPPVDITCTGPFHFDLVRYVASFDQNVKIRQLNPNGPGYALDANQLDIHFSPRALESGAPAPAIDANRRQQSELRRIEPSLIVAQGEPVVITSPAHSAEARAQKVQVHLGQRRVTMDGGRDTVLVFGSNVLKAPAIDYWHPADDATTRIGRFRATGPGSLYYVLNEENPSEVFQAAWQTSVELGRSNGQPMLALDGRPQLGVANAGSLTADQLRLTFRELQSVAAADAKEGKLQLIPDRLAAAGRVEIMSPTLTGRTEQLLAIFESPHNPLTNTTAAGGARDGSPATRTPESGSSQGIASQLNPSAQRKKSPTSAYHIETDRMQLGVILQGRDATPSSLLCEGNVVFREIALVPSPKQPLEFRGGQLTATGLDLDAGRIKIFGKPPLTPGAEAYTADVDPESLWVQLSGHGMTFKTDAVEVDQRENRLWSEGPGKATILVTKDMDGRATEKPYAIEIRWQEGMEFDGRRAVFRGDIRGQGPDSTLRCHQMIAKLAAPIDFNAPKGGEEQGASDIAEIEFQGQVIINHRSRDSDGPISHDRIQVVNFSINQQTGNISGRGPGVIRSTRFNNSSTGLGGLGGFGGQPAAGAANSPASASKLVFVRTDFDGPIKGNIYTRMLEFNDRVRTVFGPVDSWEQEIDGTRPDALPPESLTIECEVLRANEDPMAARAARGPGETGGNPFGPIQLHAERNVKIDARSKTQARLRANAATATYDRGKEIILLKGAPATLWLQNRPGEAASPINANSVSYSLATGLPELRGLQNAEINVPNAPQNLFGPAAARPAPGPQR